MHTSRGCIILFPFFFFYKIQALNLESRGRIFLFVLGSYFHSQDMWGGLLLTHSNEGQLYCCVFKAVHWNGGAPSLQAALGLTWSCPLENKWQPGLRILSGAWVQLFIHVWGGGEGNGIEVWSLGCRAVSRKRGRRSFFCSLLIGVS